MLPESHPLADAEIMLVLLFEHTPPDQYVEFVSIPNKDVADKFKGDDKLHIEVAQVKKLENVFDNVIADWIMRENRNGRDTYFGVCPRATVRRTREGYPMRGNNESVTHAVCAWMDYDKPTYKAVMSEKPEPTFVVSTGNGAHFYWKYPEAVPILRAVEDSERLKKKYGGDDTTDPARLLRVPGTQNWKKKTAEETKTAQVVSVTETVFEGVKEDGAVAPGQKQKSVYDLPWDLRNTIIGGASGAAGNFEPKKKEDGTPDRSSLDWKVMIALMEYGWSEEEIRVVFFDKNFGISEKMLDEAKVGNAEHYFHQTYDKARLEHQKKSLLHEDIGDIIEFESWADLRNAPPLEFAVECVLPVGGLLIISGPAKSWKSFLTQELILLLSGTPGRFMGMFNVRKPVAEGHSVVYCQAEITRGSLDHRLALMADNLKADWRKAPVKFLNRSFDIANTKHQAALIRGLQKVKAQFFIIDPLARFHHEDENKQRDMAQILGTIEAIGRQAGVLGTIIIHHHGKPPSDGTEREGVHAIRGSSVIGDWGNAHIIIRKKWNKFQGKKFINVAFELRDDEEPAPCSLILDKQAGRLVAYSEDNDNSLIVRDIRDKGVTDAEKIDEIKEKYKVSDKEAREVLARAKYAEANGNGNGHSDEEDDD